MNIGKYEDRYHDWLGAVCLWNVRSLRSMLSRWLLVPTGSAIVSPSYKRNSGAISFRNKQCSGLKRWRKRGGGHVPCWKCFTIVPAITITDLPNTTSVCVCVSGGRPSLPLKLYLVETCDTINHTAITSKPNTSQALHSKAFFVSILIPIEGKNFMQLF